MNILILANSDIGLYKFRKDLIGSFIDQHDRVYISLPYGESVPRLEAIGCIFIDTPLDRRGIDPRNDATLFWHYVRIIKKTRPDLIITYTIKPNIYGGMAARLSRRMYAVNITGLGTAFEKRGFVRSLVIGLYKIALKKAKVIFVENSSIGDEIGTLGLCEKRQICVLNGAGVNTEEFSYIDYPDNTRIRFLFVGRVMREKGVNELLHATKRLFREGYECVLDIVGPFEEDYSEEIRTAESEGWLSYHGYQEDVKPFIRDCDCFVLPSYHEGMANTNLECASSGRPIITSRIPGCKEAVVEGESGLLCKARDETDLYITMKRMMSLSAADRASMGRRGREYMKQVFDKRSVIQKTRQELFE